MWFVTGRSGGEISNAQAANAQAAVARTDGRYWSEVFWDNDA